MILKSIAVVLLLLAILFAIQVFRVKHEIAGRPDLALREHYSPQQVTVIETVRLPSIQTCFLFELQGPGASTKSRRIAMISGGADQDNWTYSGEYRSMAECEAHADHG